MFNIIGIYSGTATNGHLSTTSTSLKMITTSLIVQIQFYLYVKPPPYNNY